MLLEAEVTGKFEGAGDCAKLLYVPPEKPLTYRQSRRYQLEIEGSEEAARQFIDEVLVDRVSHDLHLGESPALEGFVFHLDYGMKPTALDHEKETILAYHAELSDPGFTITDLKITTRIYIFDESGAAGPDPFVRDIVNPAIHTWSIGNG